jgi:hypothetical protein
MINDIKLISKIVTNMDKRWSLWEYEEEEEEKEEKKLNEESIKIEEDEEIKENNDSESSVNIKQEEVPVIVKEEEKQEEIVKEKKPKLKNPFLINLSEYLVDETIVDEKNESLNNTEHSNEESSNTATSTVNFRKDLKLAQILDKLILYLRIVHSIDYYNATEYQQEDWMPNRLGILHAREKSPADKKPIKKTEIDEWIKQFEANIKSYVEYKERIDLEMAKRLGFKDSEVEVEKFLNENCKELEKDKWLCPLSGKKFKAKEYVHKHILSKHGDKIENIRKLCEYFNSFVFDPKRPYLPEHPLTRLNNSNIQNNDQQQQQHKPYYQNRYMPQQSPHQQQPYYSNNQNALLPSPGMNYQNRPNYNYNQNNYGYRPSHQPAMHNLRFKK